MNHFTQLSASQDANMVDSVYLLVTACVRLSGQETGAMKVNQ